MISSFSYVSSCSLMNEVASQMLILLNRFYFVDRPSDYGACEAACFHSRVH